MTSGVRLTAALATAVIAATFLAGPSAARPRPDWPTMPKTRKKHLPVKKPESVRKKPAETWPGLIARAQKAFGLSIVLRNSRQDFYSEDVKRVVIGLDLAAGRIIGLVVIKGDDTWGLYAAPQYIAFFPNKRAQARRARLIWLNRAGWVRYLQKRASTYGRE